MTGRKAVKITGYLEKRGKINIVRTWKKYWFVLDDRLLHYYKSQADYENISHCKGSISLDYATEIRPGIGDFGVIEIVTRTNNITLRAKDRNTQEKWLSALVDTMGQAITSPIKMRYSLDNLKLPSRTMARQNTLPPARVRTMDDSILYRIRRIGGQSYVNSDNRDIKSNSALKKNMLERQKNVKSTSSATSASEEHQSDLKDNELYQTFEKDPRENNLKCEDLKTIEDVKAVDNAECSEIITNELYETIDKKPVIKTEDGEIIENAEYIPAFITEEDKKKDHNKNCYKITENDQYLPYSQVSPQSSEDNDLEYYCTYGDFTQSAIKQAPSDTKLITPMISPQSSSEKEEVSPTSIKKKHLFNKMSIKKMCSNVMKRMRKSSQKTEEIEDPVYETVDYNIEKQQIHKIKQDADLIKALTEIQKRLEEKKSCIKKLLDNRTSNTSSNKSSSSALNRVLDAPIEESDEKLNNEEMEYEIEENALYMPSLPPKTKKPLSIQNTLAEHYHSLEVLNDIYHVLDDVPKTKKNASNQKIPVNSESSTFHETPYSIDEILSDLDKDRTTTHSPNKTITEVERSPHEDMSVRQLIEKFDQTSLSRNPSIEQTSGVALRIKEERNSTLLEDLCASLLNRHSDELNILLEQLTKVTSAPLMTPGATSSLVQTKSDTLTDEEWLAITPIRRRRHSDPDYDVPRPHRSLQILNQSLEQTKVEDETMISPKRFFGPVLPPSNDKTNERSMSWRSMTPDSLEPLQIYQAALREYQKNKTVQISYNSEELSDVFENSDASHPVSPITSYVTEISVDTLDYNLNKKNSDAEDNCKNETFLTESKNKIDVQRNDIFLDSLEPTYEISTIF